MNACYFCTAPCEEDYYCYGCEEYICDYCSKNDDLSGIHYVEDHADVPEWDTVDEEEWDDDF